MKKKILEESGSESLKLLMHDNVIIGGTKYLKSSGEKYRCPECGDEYPIDESNWKSTARGSLCLPCAKLAKSNKLPERKSEILSGLSTWINL